MQTSIHLPVFPCASTRARLTVSACATNHRVSRSDDLRRLGLRDCRTCTVGEHHARTGQPYPGIELGTAASPAAPGRRLVVAPPAMVMESTPDRSNVTAAPKSRRKRLRARGPVKRRSGVIHFAPTRVVPLEQLAMAERLAAAAKTMEPLPGGRRRYSHEVRSLAMELLAAGWSPERIARAAGINGWTVRMWAKGTATAADQRPEGMVANG